MIQNTILEYQNVSIRFNTIAGPVYAVNDVSYSLSEGETLGIVGESGSGKTIHALASLQLLPVGFSEAYAGKILYRGNDILRLPEKEMEAFRGSHIAMVFQDPMSSLNPVFTVGQQLCDVLMLRQGLGKKDAVVRAEEILVECEIPSARERLRQYPHQLSGGMRQRVMIALAIACNPRVLIADEPTTALDVTVQAEVVRMIKKLQDHTGMSVIWITHDLGVVAGIADTINVMYGGTIVERGPVLDIYRNPMHPYTIGLMRSLPGYNTREGDRRNDTLPFIKGSPKPIREITDCCPFRERCPIATERCGSGFGALPKYRNGPHESKCIENERCRELQR